MNTRAVIEIVFAVVALGGLYLLWRMVRATARTVYALESQVENLRKLEAKVAAQNEIIAMQSASIAEMKVEIAAQKTIIRLQGDGIEKLQTEVATWRDKFNALCQWVRVHAPGAPINGFLAQLEVGQGG